MKAFDIAILRKAADILNGYTVEVKNSDKLLQRPCIAMFRRSLEAARETTRLDNLAVVVHGPRGVSKTTIVNAALQVCVYAECVQTWMHLCTAFWVNTREHLQVTAWF